MSWVPIIGAFVSLIGAGLLATVSLIGAGLSFYFYWKSRTTSYRELIYSRQFEGYSEISELINKILTYLVVYEYAYESSKKILSKEKIKNQNILDKATNVTLEIMLGKDIVKDLKLKELSTKLIYKIVKWSYILPRNMIDAFFKIYNSIPVIMPKEKKKWEGIKSSFDKAHYEVYQTAEEYFKIKSLSRETKDILSSLISKAAEKEISKLK